MTRLQWMFIGGTAGAAGALAIALAVAPSTPTAATAIAAVPVVATPAPVVAAPVAVTPAPVAVPVATKAAVPAKLNAPVDIGRGESGMLVAIDPETGELGMPNAEQVAEMKLSDADMVSREGYVEVHHANGMVSIDLQGRGQDYMVVRKGPNGRDAIGCIHNPNDLENTQITPAGLEEK